MSEPLLVFYDGECGLCAGTMAWALARDREHALRAVPVQSDEARAVLGESRIKRALEELHVWSSRDGLRTGSDAVAAMLVRLPGGWKLAGSVLCAPPFQWLARPAYRWVAHRRPRMANASCALPPTQPGGA
jgi:predicted DCC family thiol-disulfide oxidoreductase YuxK